jgi:hypothetical protein
VDALGEEVGRFDPQLVICSRPNTVDPNGRPAWIELPPKPHRWTDICLDGEHSKAINPTLEELLHVVDEIERLALSKGELGNC